MCFGSQAANTNLNPAPYALNQSQTQVTSTTAPVNPAGSATDNSLGAAAVAADEQDKPTATPVAQSVSTGLQTATM